MQQRLCLQSPSRPNRMLWEHRLISAIFFMCQLLQHCNLILPTETPAGTAAKTPAILIQLWPKKIRWENPGLHSPWAFQVSRCYQNLHPHPSWSIPSPVSQLFELQGLGLLQWTSCTSHNTWFHCLYSTICHACSQPSASQASTTRMWKHPPWCHSSSQGLRGKDKRYMCQVFPRWRVLVCLKPFQFMFARDISIISSFWHGSGSQLWSTIFLQLRVVLVGKGHHFLFP